MKSLFNEQKLVSQVMSGDERAVRHLYFVVRRRLEPIFLLRIPIHEDVDELIQDTFLHFLDALPLFRFQSSLMTFVIGIGRHELMDYWRKRYAKRVIKTVPVLADIAVSIKPSLSVSMKMHQAMEEAYVQLKPAQVMLLRRKYEDGMSVKEIAMELGWTTKAVEAQLYRARRAFQEVYVPVEEWE